MMQKKKKNILNLNYPIDAGIVQDWDDLMKIWEYGIKTKLGLDSTELNAMLTESPFNINHSRESRENIAIIIFEEFGLAGLYIANPCVLSLFGAGKTTGVTIDSGNGATYIVPVVEGAANQKNTLWFHLGGRDITNYLIHLLHEDGISFETVNERRILKEIKEKACYVALDYEDVKKRYKKIKYEMPDGTLINLKDYTYRVPELLFKPEIFGREDGGVDSLCLDSINKIDTNLRKELYQSIILAGGTTLFKGFPERLSKEIKQLVPESLKNEVNVIATPGREHIAWSGGAILSNLSTFQNKWITKTEYQEYGVSIIHKKIFNRNKIL